MKQTLAILCLLTLSTISTLGQAKAPIGLREAIRQGPSNPLKDVETIEITPIKIDLQWVNLPSNKPVSKEENPLLSSTARLNQLEYCGSSNRAYYARDDVWGPEYRQVPVLPDPQRISKLKTLADVRECLGNPPSLVIKGEAGASEWGFFTLGEDGKMTCCLVSINWDKFTNITTVRLGRGERDRASTK